MALSADGSSPTDQEGHPEENGGSPSMIEATHEGEHHGDHGDSRITLTRATYIFALCASVNSCNLGYDIGVSTKAGKLVQADMGLSRTQREIFVGSIDFWAIFGAIGAQFLSDRFGRRSTFLIAAVGFIIGVIIQASAHSYAVLLMGRCFVGLGVGTGLAIDPLYIAEITPAKFRGELVTWAEIALNVGLVLGFSMGLFLAALPDGAQWRAMFLFGAFLPVVMIILVIKVVPESPRWLVAKNRHDEAYSILQRIYPVGYDVTPVVDDIKESLERDEAAGHSIGWGTICFPTPAVRRMLLVGVGLPIAQQAVGIDAIQYYLLDVLEKSGIESETNQTLVLILLGLIKLFFIFVGGRYFDRRGRRPLLMASLSGMSVALLMLSIGFFVKSNLSAAFAVISLGLYLAFFSIGIGPGAWLVASEVFATCIRAKAMSLATMSNRITATLMSSTFLSTAHAMSLGGFFLLLCIICLTVAAFLHIFLPETRGRSLEDMSVYFAEVTGDRSILEAETRLRSRPIELNLVSKVRIEGTGPTSFDDKEVL